MITAIRTKLDRATLLTILQHPVIPLKGARLIHLEVRFRYTCVDVYVRLYDKLLPPKWRQLTEDTSDVQVTIVEATK